MDGACKLAQPHAPTFSQGELIVAGTGTQSARTLLFQETKNGEGTIKEICELDNRPVERMPGEGSPGRQLGKPAEDSDLDEVSFCGQGPRLLSLFQFFSP